MSVLVILRESETDAVLPWAERFARARGNRLIVVRPCAAESDYHAEDIHARDGVEPTDAGLKNLLTLLRQRHPHPADSSAEEAETARLKPLHISLRALSTEDFADTALAFLDEIRPDLLILPRPLDREGPVRKVFRAASCEVMVIDVDGVETTIADPNVPLNLRRILVPTSSGSNARLALSIACEIAGDEADVEALYVEPKIGADAERVGRKILKREMRRALAGDIRSIHARVAISNDPAEAIIDVVGQGRTDLVIIGATEGLPFPRLGRNSIPDRVRRGVRGVPVAVVRRGVPLAYRFERFVIQLLRAAVPQLSREERVDLVGKIQASSSFNFDFITLICLSTLIAGLGLIRNSAAVVIGAMLVAPLMTPLVGCGLALVHGNLVLIRNAARSVMLGFLLSLAIGVALGLLVPDVTWTRELLSRGEPGRLDLIVALASGFAAAYATARPGLSGVLPGVAIAAALVPPIATTGIGLALGEWADAFGALLLFLSNIVAIVIGAAMSHYALGMRGERPRERRTLWIRPVVVTLLLSAFVLAIALGTKIHGGLDRTRVTVELRDAIETELAKSRATLREVLPSRRRGAGAERKGLDLEVKIDTPIPPTALLAAALSTIAEEHYGREVKVRVAASIVVAAEE